MLEDGGGEDAVAAAEVKERADRARGGEEAQHNVDLLLGEWDCSANAFKVEGGEGRGFPGFIESRVHGNQCKPSVPRGRDAADKSVCATDISFILQEING